MQALFDFLLSIWRELIPFALVQPWQEAVRVRWGKQVAIFGPGVHWRWWIADHFYPVTVKVKTVDLQDNSIETVDRIPIIFSIGVRYRVLDVERALVQTQDFEDSLLTDVVLIVSRWISETPYADVTVGKLVQACSRNIKFAAKRWGCEVEEVGVNTLAKHRVYHLITTPAAT